MYASISASKSIGPPGGVGTPSHRTETLGPYRRWSTSSPYDGRPSATDAPAAATMGTTENDGGADPGRSTPLDKEALSPMPTTTTLGERHDGAAVILRG